MKNSDPYSKTRDDPKGIPKETQRGSQLEYDMFRLHKIKSDRLSLGERIDFNISQFKALQVPRGWDKLYVTVISVETGKTIARLSKSAVTKNGSCHWNESLAESVWVSPDESSKELEDCIFKFVVAMGSARSGILGEATVNMASYMTSDSCVLASFPLKKCEYSTVLQAKIQCLTPIPNLRDGEGKEDLVKEDARRDSEEKETTSDQEFDCPSVKSPESYSTSDTASTPMQANPEAREASSSTTNSPRSEDSEELLAGRRDPFPRKLSPVRTRNGTRLINSASRNSLNLDRPFSARKILNTRRLRNSGNHSKDEALRIMDSSSQTLLEAAEETIEDLRGQARMWERTARKMMMEMDFLKKEHVELSRNQGNLEMEFWEASAERDGLRREVEQLKQKLGKAKQKPPPLNDHPREGAWESGKELEREISFQKQANANLTIQLKRSQESNLKLVAVLQDLEETLEKQKVEIESLYDVESRFSELEDALEESLENNRKLTAHILKLQEFEKWLLSKVNVLELALEKGKMKIENGEPTEELEAGLTMKEAEIADLHRCRIEAEARISVLEKEKSQMELDLELVSRENEIATRCLNDLQNDLTIISSNVDTHVSVNTRRSTELERNKQELELCLSELRQENEDLSTHIVELETRLRSESSEHESQVCDLEEELKKKLLKDKTETEYSISAQETERLKLELEVKVTELSTQLYESKSEIEGLETTLQANEEEIRNLQRWKSELEAKLSVIQDEKDQLEQKMEEIMKDNDIATRCFSELQSELIMIGNRVDSHTSAKESLERKYQELEKQKHDLEQRLSSIEQDREELLMRRTELETQLRSEAASELVSLMHVLEEKEEQLREAENKYNKLSQQFESNRIEMEITASELTTELNERISETRVLESVIQSKEEEIGNLKMCSRESESEFLALAKEKCQVEQEMETVMKVNFDARNQLKDLLNSIDSRVHEEEIPETRSSELSGRKQENVDLSSFISSLEAKILHLKSERESTQLENERATFKSRSLQEAYEVETESLMEKVAAFKENQERLESENRRMSSRLEKYKSSEEKFRTTINDVELKLTVSDYDRQKVKEESTKLKVELLKLGPVREHVTGLKNQLSTSISEKDKLKSSLDSLTMECQQMEAEKNSLADQVVSLQKLVDELEEHKGLRVVLEQKLMQMEKDLLVKEALCERDQELSNEITKMRKANKQLQKRIDELEDEKEECLERARTLEEEIVILQEEELKHNQNQFINEIDFSNLTEQKEEENGSMIQDENDKSFDEEISEAINLHFPQKNIDSERLSSESNQKSKQVGFPSEERTEEAESSLERELREIRERYLDMSLKYAEVEAQRGELVMKLRAVTNGKVVF